MGMFSQTDQDLHHAAFLARNAKVNRDGWKTEGLASSAARLAQGEEAFVERMRCRFGETLIGIGQRMTGTAISHPPAPAPKGYGPAV
jgi:hypothetical protein